MLLVRPIILFLIFPFWGVASLFAHASGESYVYLEFEDGFIDGRFEFSVDELKEKLGIDAHRNGETSVELLKETAPQAHSYIRERFSIGPDATETYPLQFDEATFFDREGGWAQYHFRVDADPIPPELRIFYNIGFDGDRLHRGVLVIEEGEWPSDDYSMIISLVFSPSNNTQTLDTVNPPQVMNSLRMIWQGMLHIWIGIDHILFLLALALPIVLVRKENEWAPAPSLGKSLISLIKIVTVFTIAHSITLLLASLDFITLPSRLVESVIALSIILVALNNIIGRSQNTSLIVILVLGLFHGLGFASVMGDLSFRIAEFGKFIMMILGFNLGVEIGQIAILLVAFPLLYALRSRKFYSPLVLTGGSAALVAVAGYWFIERALGI